MGEIMAGIARMRAVVLDCPDPKGLARFYGALLGWDVTDESDDWVTISDGTSVPLAFQRAEGHTPPRWPDPERSQQFHLDVTVDDIDKAEAEVLGLGAVKHDHQPVGPYEGFRVYLDPAGHPFCLCWD
jgi:predicted enzyme related to lactoylglutathione lyase